MEERRFGEAAKQVRQRFDELLGRYTSATRRANGWLGLSQRYGEWYVVVVGGSHPLGIEGAEVVNTVRKLSGLMGGVNANQERQRREGATKLGESEEGLMFEQAVDMVRRLEEFLSRYQG